MGPGCWERMADHIAAGGFAHQTRRGEAAREAVLGALPAAVPLLLGFLTIALVASSDGGYFPHEWNWACLALLWVTAMALLLGTAVALSRAELLLLGLLSAFVLWVALSTIWSTDQPRTVLEIQRDLLYVAAGAALMLTTRRRYMPQLLAGVLSAIAVIGTYALATRLFPERIGIFDPVSGYRLATPLGYWNALGLFVAMGALLAVGFAARARTPLARALAAACVAPLMATLYFTFSRGAWLALGIALILVLILDPRRLQLASALLLVGGPAAAGVWFASRADALTHTNATVSAASHDGHGLALLLALLVLAAAAGALLLGYLERQLTPSRNARIAYAIALLCLVAAAIGTASAHYGSPPTVVKRAYNSFKAPPPAIGANLNSRLFSFSSNGRLDLWRAGW